MAQLASTREQLLHSLQVQGSQTASELSQELGIGSTAVRQHIDRLQAEGLVEQVGLRRGNGRPGHVYGLTAQADSMFPHSYDQLALDLMEAVRRLPDGAELLAQSLDSLHLVWLERYAAQVIGENLEERVAALTDVLNERGNMARYEQLPDGSFCLAKHNCTLKRVTAQFPQICQQEEVWFSEALGVPVVRTDSRAKGAPQCTFRIEAKV